jgi:hypothetical protein
MSGSVTDPTREVEDATTRVGRCKLVAREMELERRATGGVALDELVGDEAMNRRRNHLRSL